MSPHPAPLPCIIDTDPGVDDVLAILLALASPELLIVAITITHGNCTRDCALLNLQKTFSALEHHLEREPSERQHWPGLDLGLRQKLGYGPIQVILGSEGPIEGEASTAGYFHGRDGLSNIADRHPSLAASESRLYQLSDRTSTEALPPLLASQPPRSLAYVALGPLTSLAHLHNTDSSLLEQFATILVMGGSVDAPGNTSPVAEFNSYADPFAAQLIFGLNLPSLYLFPLDLTGQLTLPFTMYKSLVDDSFEGSHAPSTPTGKSHLVHFCTAFLEVVVETMRKYGGDAMEMHDPTVIWALIDYARHRQLSARGSPSTPPVSGLEPRRGSEMRRRVEADGFTRDVVERRRSVELAMAAKLQRDAQAMPLGHVREMAPGEEEVEVLQESGSSGEDLTVLLEDDAVFAPGWEWQQRSFEVETTGALTRGMLVVDRRASATAPAGLAARQTNRALDLEEAEAREREEESGPLGVASGARVVIESPGSETLRMLMLERIWRVRIGLP